MTVIAAEPYDPTDPFLTNTRTPRENILDLFTYPPLHVIGTEIDAALAAGKSACGRKKKHTAAAMLLMVVATAAAGSREKALRLVDQETWDAGVATLPPALAQTFCTTPPTRDDVKYFRNKIVEVDGVLAVVQQLFLTLSIKQARSHGNLLPGGERDGARPDRRTTIYGDGTVVTAYSDLTIHEDPVTGTTFVNGSRTAPERARVQRVQSDMSQDGKTVTGINYVFMHTWTQYGRVTLSTGTALGAELWPALGLVEQIVDAAGDGVHTLLYDRVFTGWPTENLMAVHGIDVVNKSVARPSSHEVHNLTEKALAGQAARLVAEHTDGPVSKEVLDHLRRRLKRNLLAEGLALPVGVSLYETTSNQEADLITSKYSYLDNHVHPTVDGPCEHRLVVDDGGLYLVHYDDELGCDVKSTAVDCTAAKVTGSAGSHERASTWLIPCTHGDTELILTWTPRATRYQASDDRERPPTNAMTQLRPLHRGHAAFGATANHRNDTESFNSWFKRTLPNSRARTYILVQQELDCLAAAMLNNSITLHRSMSAR